MAAKHFFTKTMNLGVCEGVDKPLVKAGDEVPAGFPKKRLESLLASGRIETAEGKAAREKEAKQESKKESASASK